MEENIVKILEIMLEPMLYCSSGKIKKHAYEVIHCILMQSKLDVISRRVKDLVTSGHGWCNFTAVLLMFPLECVLMCVYLSTSIKSLRPEASM